MDLQHRKLRKRLLNWHYAKSRRVDVVDLLDSSYQAFRHKVSNRLSVDLDFRSAIKKANKEELVRLDIIRNEMRLKI